MLGNNQFTKNTTNCSNRELDRKFTFFQDGYCKTIHDESVVAKKNTPFFAVPGGGTAQSTSRRGVLTTATWVFQVMRKFFTKAVNSEKQVLGGSPHLESWLVNEVTSHSVRVPTYLPFGTNMISSKGITEVSYKVHILGKGSSSMCRVITRLRTMVIHHLLNGMILGSQIAEIGWETRCFNHSYRTLR